MGQIGTCIRRVLYRSLSLENYLKVLSSAYLWGYRMGLSPHAEAYEYPRFLKYLIAPGDTVIDIGANLGYYSYAMARLTAPSGKVYAVEPVAPIRRVLEHNLRRFRNVEVLACALGAEDKRIRMGNGTVDRNGYFGTGQNFVVDRPTEGLQLMEFEAEMCRGSQLFADLTRLDLIKCDIEGYEGVVLPEMKPLIERFRPTVLLETGGDTRTAMLSFFKGLGYDDFTLQSERLVSHAERSEKDIVFIHGSKVKPYEKWIEPCA